MKRLIERIRQIRTDAQKKRIIARAKPIRTTLHHVTPGVDHYTFFPLGIMDDLAGYCHFVADACIAIEGETIFVYNTEDQYYWVDLSLVKYIKRLQYVPFATSDPDGNYSNDIIIEFTRNLWLSDISKKVEKDDHEVMREHTVIVFDPKDWEEIVNHFNDRKILHDFLIYEAL